MDESSSICPPSIHDLNFYEININDEDKRRKILKLKKMIIFIHKYIGGSLDCTQNISEKHTKLINMSKKLNQPLTAYEVFWICDQVNLMRHLVSRDWYVSEALNLLLENIINRRSIQPERIAPSKVRIKEYDGQIYRRGFDKNNQPIIYLKY